MNGIAEQGDAAGWMGMGDVIIVRIALGIGRSKGLCPLQQRLLNLAILLGTSIGPGTVQCANLTKIRLHLFQGLSPAVDQYLHIPAVEVAGILTQEVIIGIATAQQQIGVVHNNVLVMEPPHKFPRLEQIHWVIDH